MLEHLSIYIHNFGGITFSISMYIMCVLVQRFEPQGRRFTNFHYYYYIPYTGKSYDLEKRGYVSAVGTCIRFLLTVFFHYRL